MLTTATGSVTFPTVIWLYRKNSMAAIHLKQNIQFESPK